MVEMEVVVFVPEQDDFWKSKYREESCTSRRRSEMMICEIRRGFA